MDKQTLDCTLLTPMFSYGAYSKKVPELRASELKGIMRYVYRIACTSKVDQLLSDEQELFGGAADSAKQRHASPIRLLLRGDLQKNTKKRWLLYHENKECCTCFEEGLSFAIDVRLNDLIWRNAQSGWRTKADLNWYVDLIRLSLMLCGLGRRTRKCKGSVDVTNHAFKHKSAAVRWICDTLNRIANTTRAGAPIYEVSRDGIVSTFPFRDCRCRRPMIQKIVVGEPFSHDQIDHYLRALDQACHDAKDSRFRLPEEIDRKALMLSTGTASNKRHDTKRLASPLLSSIIKIKDDYYPIHTFVKVVTRDINDDECALRDHFLDMVERERQGVPS